MKVFQSPHDKRDWVFEHVARGNSVKLPPEHSYQFYCRPARDQNDRSTCVAFVGTSICEILTGMRGERVDLSPEFIYYHRANNPASGMFGRNLLKILQKIGTVPEEYFPYQKTDLEIEKPTSVLYKEAENYKINSYARITTLQGLKLAIYEVGPVYMLLPLYTSRPKFWKANNKPVGSHAVAVIGYDNNGFILKNSWGSEWNDAGTIVLGYEDWDCVIECWLPYNTAPNLITRRLSDAVIIEPDNLLAGHTEHNKSNKININNKKISVGDERCCTIS